jgi:hypothetical protein
MREKACPMTCQMACEIWHGILGHDIYGLTFEIWHGIDIMLVMIEMPLWLWHERWHGVIWDDIYGMTWEKLHGIYIMLAMKDMPLGIYPYFQLCR